MKWTVKNFAELTADELYEILRLRVDVFVVEQECPYPEIDGHDRAALHLSGWEGDTIAAYARIIKPGEVHEDPAIGRVIVRKSHRGKGIARELVERAKEVAAERYGDIPVHLSAQLHLKEFYASCGFRPVSEPYDEDGIPHVDMRLVVSCGK
ncbi:MAG: GNAT family N-acetyltransferase [Bhargavaea sp.]|uniref:GNAT family N-acetyltransferase n=2 Tax=Bhargavaea changchunensis TaxID=2134037 RepID=A0ABW2NJN8_9BACL|nr:GNAT family N-acetyltransferase [Bhargavaea sp. CC-171006]